MIIYEFSKKRSKKRYHTIYSPFDISRYFYFDAELNGESIVLSLNQIDFKSFRALEV